MAKEPSVVAAMAATLSQVVQERVETKRAVLRGEAIRKPGVLVGGSDFVALYATLPVYYPKEMWGFDDKDGKVVFCWLVPIKESEWLYLSKNGWSETSKAERWLGGNHGAVETSTQNLLQKGRPFILRRIINPLFRLPLFTRHHVCHREISFVN